MDPNIILGCSQYKLAKLKDDVRKLEGELAAIDWDTRTKQSASTLKFLNSNHRDFGDERQEMPVENLRHISELSSKASNFTIEESSRNLRVSPGELYVYDCWIQGVTSAVRFDLKFVETVQGSGDGCGEISDLKAEVRMIRDDPESLSEWLAAYCKSGDLPELVNGLVEFSNLAKIRRNILKALYERSTSGQLGSCGIKGKGVLVVGVGSDGKKVFSITWKIVYSEPIKSMMSSFDVEFHRERDNFEAHDAFASLQRKFLKEDVLPEIWESVAEALMGFAE